MATDHDHRGQTHEYETLGPIAVSVELGMGHIRLTTVGDSKARVRVAPSNPDRRADVRAADATRVDLVSHRLSIAAMRRWARYSPFGDGGSVDVEIELPIGSAVEGSLDLGPIVAVGELGATRLRTGLGSVRVERTGPLTVVNGHGEVSVEAVEGDADVSTASGVLRIRTIEGRAVLKNSNGDTVVESVSGDIDVRGANGNISIGRAGGSVRARSANGSVRVVDVERGTVELFTAAGEIAVGVHEGSAVWLDATTRHGNVRNSLDPGPTPSETDTVIELRARTTVGDIVVSRAPARH